jgi:hypothetical protein
MSVFATKSHDIMAEDALPIVEGEPKPRGDEEEDFVNLNKKRT